MIITALATYYNRAILADEDLPPFGLEKKRIPFLVEITKEGAFSDIRVLREDSKGEGKKGKEFLVPQGVKKTSGISANLLWENIEYTLGCAEGGDVPADGDVPRRHGSFIAAIENLPPDIVGMANVAALLKFLQTPDKLTAMRAHPSWEKLVSSRSNLVSFVLRGENVPVCSDAAILGNLPRASDSGEADGQLCIVSGKKASVAKLHPPIKGVYGAKTSGANIVSFNIAPYCSYGKAQGGNSPMDESVIFRYTTGLNHLLRKESKQKCLLGGSTVVFWAREKHAIEQDLSNFITGKDGEQTTDSEQENSVSTTEIVRPGAGAKKMKAAIESPLYATGMSGSNPNDFYVLGLAPNAARIAIRFWHKTTVADVVENIQNYFAHTRIVAPKDRDEELSIYQILRGVAAQGKMDNLSPLLAGQWIKAIIAGHAYPRALLQAAVIRCRADQSKDTFHYNMHARAAAIKACIVSPLNYSDNHKEQYTMLDPDFDNPGYVLGRLFAILERVQAIALGNINASIKDRYYGAASATPKKVFSFLLRNSHHHIGKLTDGQRVFYEKLTNSTMHLLDARLGIPPVLKLEDQGRFALGYYHQRQDFFTSKQDKENTND